MMVMMMMMTGTAGHRGVRPLDARGVLLVLDEWGGVVRVTFISKSKI